MTAFVNIQSSLDIGIFEWEIKSVNHRYLDLSFRLPETLRFLESQFRTIVRSQVGRGKVECQLKFKSAIDAGQDIEINTSLVQGLLKAANRLATSELIPNDLSVNSILSWPGAIQINTGSMEQHAQTTLELFEKAISQFIEARKIEGSALKEHILTRLASLNSFIQASESLVETLSQELREKLQKRIKMLNIEVEHDRLEQEIVLMVMRADVREELDRLKTHVDEVERILNSKATQGRRLDFLMQELNREANTLGAKSESTLLTQHAIEMKVLIEQMREQIQNIE